MDIAEKMKQDWEQRAQHHARFWIATEHYQNEEVFSQSGQETAQCLMTAIGEVYQPNWRYRMWNRAGAQASGTLFSNLGWRRCFIDHDFSK